MTKGQCERSDREGRQRRRGESTESNRIKAETTIERKCSDRWEKDSETRSRNGRKREGL